MRAAGLDVPELFALCLFIVSFQVHHGEKLIGDLGRHLSPRVHQLVVRQPMLEGADDVVLLNEKKRVLLEEAANIRAQGLVIALQDLVQHPPIAGRSHVPQYWLVKKAQSSSKESMQSLGSLARQLLHLIVSMC